jgi:RNA polymerase sigma-70 factor (ECF subfamily)
MMSDPIPSGADGPGDDLELVRLTLEGDVEAFEELFRRHRTRVYRIGYRYTKNREDALELVQDVFIKAHRALGTFDQRAAFTTWLSRIAMNAGIDRIRRRRGDELEYRDELETPEGGPAPVAFANPGAEALRKELGEKIRDAVEKLSEKHRAVFLLHAVEGLTYREIADTLDIAIGTVMSRLHYARKYLRDLLQPYVEGEGEGLEEEGAT